MRRTLALVGCVGLLAGVALLAQRPAEGIAQPKKDALPKVPEAAFVVAPYLQFPTQNRITIMWETAEPTTGSVEFGPGVPLARKVESAEKKRLHEVTLDNLDVATKYIYRVVTSDGASGYLQFTTAVRDTDAYSFAIVGDTQGNPVMTGKVAKQIFERRPNFVVHCGDVVDNGPVKREWVEELFRPCAELFSRAAVFPTIGNHERNHAHYYQYFALPKPKYHYRYRYGNADYFVIDSNKSLKPDSEQYQWLDKELAASTAKWKFAYHHHPLFSSDADDYGNTLQQSKLPEGDVNVRHVAALYEKYSLDIAFNGHIHLYERSWPVRAGKIDREKGVIYLNTGGGGGKLEAVGPTPTWFKKQCRTEFHYCVVNIHGGSLEFKAFDYTGMLFDQFELNK